MRPQGESGQALILAIGGIFVLLAGALALVAIAGAVTGKGRVQRAADLAAISAARSMRDDLSRLLSPPTLANGLPNPAHLDKGAYLARARLVAVEAGKANGVDPTRLRLGFPDASSFAPVRVKASVVARLEVGAEHDEVEASAVAEAAAPLGIAGGGVSTMASGGGYSGPLAHRTGEGMRPDVAAAFDRMAAAARGDGISLLVVSGFRSDAEQAALFAAHPDPTWVAPPGHSLHRCATELDLGPDSAYAWLATNASRFGFVQRYSWEAWHYECLKSYNFPMETYAAVVRVSHMGNRKQGSDNFHADGDQVATVEAWGKANGVRVEVLEPELNVSGGLPIEKRPTLVAAIEGVEQGIYAGIVVAYLSRLGRNVAEQLRTWSRVEAAGGKVVSIKEGIDTSTASGRLHRNLLISIDAHEREQHAERFDERRRFATEAGIWQRRQLPRGYLKREDRRLMPDPGKREEVVATFSSFLQGVNISELGRRLGMTQGGVRALLRNRVYLGELRVGQYVNPDSHEPLIDHQTFDEAQRKLAENTRPPRSVTGPALLAGLVRCASCGHVMTRSGRGKARKHDHNYLCVGQHSGESCPAPAGIVTRRLDEYVEQVALVELQRLQVEVADTDGAAEAQAAVAAAELELDAYLDAVRASDIGSEAFATGARKRSEAVEAAKDVLYAALARRPADPALGSGTDAWKSLNVHERNALLRSLLAAVIVRPAGKGRRVPVEDRTRVVAYGTELVLPTNRGHLASGIVPIFPDADDIGVLTIPAAEDALKTAGGAV